jgi:hypothetical protein
MSKKDDVELWFLRALFVVVSGFFLVMIYSTCQAEDRWVKIPSESWPNKAVKSLKVLPKDCGEGCYKVEKGCDPYKGHLDRDVRVLYCDKVKKAKKAPAKKPEAKPKAKK